MCLRVWVLHPHTHTHKPAGFVFLPINKPTGRKIDPYLYPNRVKIHRIFGFCVPIAIFTCATVATSKNKQILTSFTIEWILICHLEPWREWRWRLLWILWHNCYIFQWPYMKRFHFHVRIGYTRSHNQNFGLLLVWWASPSVLPFNF